MDAAIRSMDFSLAFQFHPHEAMACLTVAAHEVLYAPGHARHEAVFGHRPRTHKRVVVRLTNPPGGCTPLRSLRSSLVNQLVRVRGTVVKAGPVHPMASGMEFGCSKCQEPVWHSFPDYHYVPPSGKCRQPGCNSRSWVPRKASVACVDFQSIKLQELASSGPSPSYDADDPGGRIPRSVEVELSEDLAGACCAGDSVEVVAVLKLRKDQTASRAASEGMPGKAKGQSMSGLYTFYLEAAGVTLLGRSGQHEAGPGEGGGDRRTLQASQDEAVSLAVPGAPSFTLEELDFIVTFKEECRGQYLKQLVRAFCPQIYGNSVIKAGLLLALFGGVPKNVGGGGGGAGEGGEGGEAVPPRGNVHALLVGDPGLGKSQMLRGACDVSPRSIYVCGNSSTTAGLTVSIKKDSGKDGEYNFEAGAVVLADRGVGEWWSPRAEVRPAGSRVPVPTRTWTFFPLQCALTSSTR